MTFGIAHGVLTSIAAFLVGGQLRFGYPAISLLFNEKPTWGSVYWTLFSLSFAIILKSSLDKTEKISLAKIFVFACISVLVQIFCAGLEAAMTYNTGMFRSVFATVGNPHVVLAMLSLVGLTTLLIFTAIQFTILKESVYAYVAKIRRSNWKFTIVMQFLSLLIEFLAGIILWFLFSEVLWQPNSFVDGTANAFDLYRVLLILWVVFALILYRVGAPMLFVKPASLKESLLVLPLILGWMVYPILSDYNLYGISEKEFVPAISMIPFLSVLIINLSVLLSTIFSCSKAKSDIR